MRKLIIFLTALCILLAVVTVAYYVMTQRRECTIPISYIGCPDDQNQPYIEMYILPETVSRESLYVKLVNNTDEEYAYGYYYNLYLLYADNWVRLRNNAVFDSIAIHLNPNSYSIMHKDLHRAFGELPCGIYKITKNVSLANVHPNRGFDVFATFVLRGGDECTCW